MWGGRPRPQAGPLTGPSELVLDTNVLVSAFTHHQGISLQIWESAIQRRYRLLSSPALVAESGRCPSTKVLLGRRTGALHVVADDDDDNRILEFAVAGKANLVVSGDRHLRKIKSYEGIGVVTPIDFHRIPSS
jgi:predicted nucleic acid-binding protein